ncbi:F-box protein SKIP19-like [Trifolium pratense]|uniref:F-box protein SKIP19-like n=1 Tax=Trifolium pratense TaxID=57577 RepID=UPI001E6914CC|nr:F-box protein SKIP19-like [Trifolium pratense]
METPLPNWLELPREITINILQRLDTVEIVTSVCVVCPLWWNICKDPLMWRTIGIISLSYFDERLEKICRYAVDRSSGYLKDIYIKKFATDDLINHIANSTSELRCIKLEECHGISSQVFSEVVKKQPFLEELEIAYCDFTGTEFFEYIGRCCPLLKSLKFSRCFEESDKCDDIAFAIAKTMSTLRHLTIINIGLTNDGLLAILDGCAVLESLDLRGCRHLDLDGSLGKRCNEQIKELRFPTESVDPNSSWINYISEGSLYINDYDFSSLLSVLEEIPYDPSNFIEF